MEECKEIIWVVGYPKSGTVWMQQVLSDLLNCPRVHGRYPMSGDAEDVYAGDFQRPNNYGIGRTHTGIRPGDGKVIANTGGKSPYVVMENQKVFYIMRDIRDVVISTAQWQVKSGKPWTLVRTRDNVMAASKATLSNGMFDTGSWHHHVSVWTELAKTNNNIHIAMYEDLKKDPVGGFVKGLEKLGLPVPPIEKVQEIIENRDSKKVYDKIKTEKKHARYAQHIRHGGHSGRWKNYFYKDAGDAIEKGCGPLLREVGYDAKVDWWKALPDQPTEVFF